MRQTALCLCELRRSKSLRRNTLKRSRRVRGDLSPAACEVVDDRRVEREDGDVWLREVVHYIPGHRCPRRVVTHGYSRQAGQHQHVLGVVADQRFERLAFPFLRHLPRV